jgi:signal transduction histidine kinase
VSSKADELRALNRELMQKNLELSRALEERDRLLHQLVEAEKLAALGQLVAGFAHEINTPIGIAVTATTTLQDRVRKLLGLMRHEEIDEAEVEDLLDDILKVADLCIGNLQRASRLVGSFKRVSVEQMAERKERFSVLEVIRDTVASLQPALKQDGVKIEIRGEEDVELYNAPGTLSQAITNLVLNAVKHAYPPERTFSDKRVVIETWRDLDEFYLIEVRDLGVGIDPEYRRRIFEPFETTARGRKGTGLGLTIARNIVTGLFGGTITCDSEPGKGTTFFVRLPVHGRETGEPK